jgi:predicted nucleotidyltransferase
MYSADEIQKIVASIAEKYNIPAVYLFGSYAKGEATDTSDIDFVFDLNGSKLQTAIELCGLFADLKDSLPCGFDLVTLRQLHLNQKLNRNMRFTTSVLESMVKIYERKRLQHNCQVQ